MVNKKEEEAEFISKVNKMKKVICKNVIYVRGTATLTKIVGLRESHNALIVKDLATYPKIADSRKLSKLIFRKIKKVKEIYFMPLKVLPSKEMMCGILIVVVVTT